MILIIDDEPDLVAFLGTFLEDHGYEVRAATDPDEGLALLRSQRPDLLLLDLEMPGKTGIKVYVELCREGELRDLPVIFITGLGQFDLFDEACRPLPPPKAVLDKPIDRAALLAAVRRVVG